MTGLTDEDLLALLKNEDRKAFTVLYDRYWERMTAKAFSAIGSPIDAEEIVQDAFVDLWEQRKSIVLRYSFNTYLSAIVKYKIYAKLVEFKKSKGSGRVNIEDMEFVDDSTQQNLQFDDLRLHIESAMNVLPEKCRLIFHLSRFRELSNEEIAQSLNISKKTVEAHITKALKTLKENIRKIDGPYQSLLLFLLK